METIFFEGDNARTADTCTKLKDDGSSLEVFTKCAVTGTWVYLAEVPLGAYRLFRPDHDSQYTSPNGRTWKPVN